MAAAHATVDEDEERRLRAFVRGEVSSGRVPFLGLYVARASRVVFEAYESRPGAGRLHGDAILRIYSMSKPLVSVAALMLVDDGRLALDDPISAYLDEWKDEEVRVHGGGPARGKITVRHLLTHTAGFTYQFSIPGVTEHEAVKELYRANRVGVDDISLRACADGGRRDTLRAFVARLNGVPLVAQPGERFEYSVATDVLGAVIEGATSMTLGAFLKRAIFDPLGMHSTGFSLTEAQAPSLLPCYAYVAEGEWERAPPPAVSVLAGGGRDSAPGGGGGLFSSVQD